MIDNFEFISPTKIYFGREKELLIGQIFKERNFTRVYVVIGQGSVKKSGLLDRVLLSLDKENIEYQILEGVRPNPTIELCRKGKKQANRKTKLTTIATDPDTIIIRINRRVFNYVTAVAASIVLFFTFTSPYGNPVANESQKADTELLITPKLVPVAKPQPKKTEQPVVAVKTVEEAPVAEAVAEPEPKQEAPKEEILPLKGDGGAPYVIVLASAISKKNALSYAAKLQEQGFKAQACEFGGMVRVIIPGFETQDDAYAEIRRMKTEGKDLSHAWPCYVKDEIKPIE